jgi:hypothetical protein
VAIAKESAFPFPSKPFRLSGEQGIGNSRIVPETAPLFFWLFLGFSLHSYSLAVYQYFLWNEYLFFRQASRSRPGNGFSRGIGKPARCFGVRSSASEVFSRALAVKVFPAVK